MKKPALILGTLFLLAVAWAIYYTSFSGPHFPQVPKSKIPPPVVITLSRSNAPLQVASGAGSVMFVLPDGSLWRWGMAYGSGTSSRALVPEQVGTDRNWMQVSSLGTRVVALRTDHTLWEWSLGSANSAHQIDSHSEWVSATANGPYALALKKDGSLWTWGNSSQPGVSSSLNGTNLIQVGTNQDWVALSSGSGASAYLLRKDHTIWVWGQTYNMPNASSAFYSVPIQFSSDTNWVSMVSGPMLFLRNSIGEVYYPFPTSPQDAPILKSTSPLATNIFSDQIAFGYTGKPKLFAIHLDGTMWETSPQWGSKGVKTTQKWRRFGNRSDWVSIWNCNGPTLALTRDGTLWMWGQDLGQEPILDTRSKISQLKNLILTKLGRPPSSTSTSAMCPFQTEPRPLLRLVYSNTNQTAAQK